MRRTLVYAALLTFALGVPLLAAPAKKQDSPPPTPTPATQPSPPAAAAVPLPTPLPAELFTGRVRDAYKAAAEIPDVLAGLACYCGCDKSQGHRHLLDCFVDDHGAG
jgi:hypothetical protein